MGNPLQYSCLGNPMDRGAWWATIHAITKSRTRLSMHACTYTHTQHTLFQGVKTGHSMSRSVSAASLFPIFHSPFPVSPTPSSSYSFPNSFSSYALGLPLVGTTLGLNNLLTPRFLSLVLMRQCLRTSFQAIDEK